MPVGVSICFFTQDESVTTKQVVISRGGRHRFISRLFLFLVQPLPFYPKPTLCDNLYVLDSLLAIATVSE